MKWHRREERGGRGTRRAAGLADLQARKICIIKPSAFGDIVQTLPLLPPLRARFPEAQISWIVKRELADLLTGHPCLDEILPIDLKSGWRGWRRLLKEIRGCEFDLVLDLQGLLRSAMMTLASAAPTRVGLQTAREGANWACNAVIPRTGRQIPAHARYWRVAEVFGVGAMRRETTVWISQQDRQWACRQLSALPGPVVAIHPGAKWRTKRWPAEKFAAIASRAMGPNQASVAILGDRSEIQVGGQLESALIRTRGPQRVVNLAGQTSLKQLVALLGHVAVLLTNDSGPMHLAAGLGTPVLGVFTCTSPQRSGPPGQQHEFVETQVDCAASYRKQCPRRGSGRLACLAELDTDRVWRAYQRLIEKNRLIQRAA